ncbi:MAG TPA: lytic transglycosylase domain-containing protein, partial [Conexibacter sp.]|nr:lytic transglycosylase domain-containing protein [Conexibacter sp.]
ASRVATGIATGGASVATEVTLLLVGLGLAAFVVVLLMVGMIIAGAGIAEADSAEAVPDDCLTHMPIYKAASERFGLGERGVWVLASVHQVETGFDGSDGGSVSSRGARGPMQFLPSTWRKGVTGGTRIVVPPTTADHEGYATDGDGDGMADIDNVHDAIHSAARYLRASGAPADWSRAIFAYNHADWYVKKVLDGVDALDRSCVRAPSTRPGPLGDLPEDPLERITYVANWIEAQRFHYCWGGGHAPKPGPSPSFSYCWRPSPRIPDQAIKTYGAKEAGLDCSGSVRWLLVLMGYKDPGPLHSSQFATEYPSREGRHVTIWSNDGHVFITINGRDWGTTSSNYAHGPGWNPQSHVGFVASHPPGL